MAQEDAGRPPIEDCNPEKVRWFRPPELPGTELLWVEQSGRLWRVYHETYTVCAPVAPASEWFYRRRELRTGIGGLMMMEPGELHVTRRMPGGPCDFRVLLLSPILVERAARELGYPGPVHLRAGHVEHGDVFQALVDFHRSIEQPATILERESRLALCLRHIVGYCAEHSAVVAPKVERDAVRRARDFIREQYADNIRLDDLATIARLSRFHLLRMFAEEMGLPPHAYQVQVRIGRARDLLAAGVPAAEVALMVGFSDQSHLTRHFKHILGTTPGAYTAAHTPRGFATPSIG